MNQKGYRQRRACALAGIDPRVHRRPTSRSDDADLRARLKDLSSERRRFGYPLAGRLYGGPEAQLPERLWAAFHDPKWKIEGLGVSALGELVGWALPDRFPPRNRRTSKSLQSLGYEVTVHV